MQDQGKGILMIVYVVNKLRKALKKIIGVFVIVGALVYISNGDKNVEQDLPNFEPTYQTNAIGNEGPTLPADTRETVDPGKIAREATGIKTSFLTSLTVEPKTTTGKPGLLKLKVYGENTLDRYGHPMLDEEPHETFWISDVAAQVPVIVSGEQVWTGSYDNGVPTINIVIPDAELDPSKAAYTKTGNLEKSVADDTSEKISRFFHTRDTTAWVDHMPTAEELVTASMTDDDRQQLESSTTCAAVYATLEQAITEAGALGDALNVPVTFKTPTQATPYIKSTTTTSTSTTTTSSAANSPSTTNPYRPTEITLKVSSTNGLSATNCPEVLRTDAYHDGRLKLTLPNVKALAFNSEL